MSGNDTFTIRPSRTNLAVLGSGTWPLEGVFRAQLSATDLASLSLKPGDFFWIRQATATAEGEIRSGLVVAARSTDPDMNGNSRAIKLTDGARAIYGIPPKSKVIVLPVMVNNASGGMSEVPRANKVLLRAEDDQGRPLRELPTGHSWEARAMAVLLGTYFPILIRHGVHRGRKINCVIEDVWGTDEAGGGGVKAKTSGVVAASVAGDPVFEIDSAMAVTFSCSPGGSSVARTGPARPSSGGQAPVRPSSTTTMTTTAKTTTTASFSVLAGLDTEIRAICDHLGIDTAAVETPNLHRLSSSRSLLIFGAAGTGKSTVLSAIGANPKWNTVRTIRDLSGSSRSVTQLGKAFEDVVACGPGLIVLPNVDGLGHRGEARNSDAIAIILELTGWLKDVDGADVTVVASAQVPNDIPAQLRNHFGREIELPIPSIGSRKAVIRSMLRRACPGRRRGGDRDCNGDGGNCDDEDDDELVQYIADKTHGYVGRDLKMLINEAVEICQRRIHKERTSSSSPSSSSSSLSSLSQPGRTPDPSPSAEAEDCLTGPSVGGGSSNNTNNNISSGNTGDKSTTLTIPDFTLGIKRIRPSALKEVVVETPKVLWSDIGGCAEVKEKLHKATLRRLKSQKLFDYFTVPPTKGILMYGPPGCSKTLTAKAAATESGFNFIAIKGAELTNMYVGETERAVREVFRKARAAQPTIVFFDEIDSIASNRFGSGGGGGKGSGSSGSSGSGSHPGLSVVTTLLNEMDGIESLDGVVVLAATNRPDALDDALVRPGRFSELIYLGPPDVEARKQILKIRTAKTPLGSDVDLDSLAGRLDGYTGAEVVEVVNQACSRAVDEFGDLFDRAGRGPTSTTTNAAATTTSTAVDVDALLETAQNGVSGLDISSPPSLSSPQPPRVYARHFDLAVDAVVPAVQPEMLAQYEAWREHRRRIVR